MHSVYIVLLSCGKGGKGAMGARVEHCCSANRTVDVLYDSESYELYSNCWAAHTHRHTTRIVHSPLLFILFGRNIRSPRSNDTHTLS